MKQRLQISVILTIVLATGICNVLAENKVFTESGEILDGEVWDIVDIYNDDTVVDMLGGIADYITTHDGSTLNVIGGSSEFGAIDYSTINISGGSHSATRTWEYGTINLSGDAGLDGVGIGDFGTINMTGGSLGNLLGRESGILNLHGGTISNLLSVNDLSIANIFGYSLFKTSSGGAYGYGYVSGFWLDDTPFTIDLYDAETFSHVNLVPEPCTLCLLGMGILIIRKRVKK